MAADGVSRAVGETRSLAGADVAREASHVVVRLWGEHDMASAAIITKALADAIDSGDADVLVDLTAVEFMDCSTLRVLVSGRAMLTRRSRRLTVRVSPIAFAHRLLVLCGLADMVEPTTAAGQRSVQNLATALESWVEVPRTAPDGAAGRDPQPDLPDHAEAESQPRESSPVTSAGPPHVR